MIYPSQMECRSKDWMYPWLNLLDGLQKISLEEGIQSAYEDFIKSLASNTARL